MKNDRLIDKSIFNLNSQKKSCQLTEKSYQKKSYHLTMFNFNLGHISITFLFFRNGQRKRTKMFCSVLWKRTFLNLNIKILQSANIIYGSPMVPITQSDLLHHSGFSKFGWEIGSFRHCIKIHHECSQLFFIKKTKQLDR